MGLNYDELYGISINEYVDAQSITISQLIDKVKVDIKLLKENLKKVLENEGITNAKVTVISNTIKKKEKHLERLRNWEEGIADD
jgi:hypothetical protein